MLEEKTAISITGEENLYIESKEDKDLNKTNETVATLPKNHININGQAREYTIVGKENTNEKKYLLSIDTVTVFDENTYEETTRVISNYTTKEIYDAYQDAKAKELYIYLREKQSEDRIGVQVHYEDVSKYLKANAPFLLEEHKTYIYEILERGKIIETSIPFKLSDLK